jgi:hypothetical protein
MTEEFSREFEKLLKQEAFVPATFLTVAALDVIPTPADIGYFKTEEWLLRNKDRLADKYYLYKALNYYGWDVAWYVSLFSATYFLGKDVPSRLKIGLGAISGGAIAYLLWKQSQKDEKGNIKASTITSMLDDTLRLFQMPEVKR